MQRLLLGLALGLIGYLIFKKVAHSLGRGKPASRAGGPQEPEELVQDPVCLTFIPRREALKGQKDGRDYFFCSEGCLKRFLRGGS